jgi:hypothetical protein
VIEGCDVMFSYVGDLISRGKTPTSIEFHDAYRNGRIASITFEIDDMFHLCYGLAEDGTIYDFCICDNNSSFSYVEGVLSITDIQNAASILDEKWMLKST